MIPDKGKEHPQPDTEMLRHDDRTDDDDDRDDEEMRVQFLDRPIFYDIAHESWNNKKLKNAELKAFADAIGQAHRNL